MELEKSDEFLLKEYVRLTAEIELHNKHEKIMELSAALGVAAIFAWLFAENIAKDFVWWTPFFVSLLCGLRQIGYRNRSLQIAEYIMGIENYFLESKFLNGWENHLNILRKKRYGKNEERDSHTSVKNEPCDDNLKDMKRNTDSEHRTCLLYTSPSPRDATLSRMPSSA